METVRGRSNPHKQLLTEPNERRKNAPLIYEYPTKPGSRSPKSPKVSHVKVPDEVAAYVQSCTRLGSQSILEYVVVLSDPSLHSCSLANRKIKLNDRDVACIAESLRQNATIEEIDLSTNGIPEASAKDLAIVLRENKTLRRLLLGDNKLGSKGVNHLATALVANAALTDLDLHANDVGNHGAATLAQALQTNATLARLDLSHNSVKAQGAIALAAALKVNTTLRALSLRFNDVGESGAAALGAALRFNTVLTDFDLGGNNIDAAGGMHLAEGVAENHIIERLNLRANDIGDDGAVVMGEAVRATRTLRELYLGNNGIGNLGCVAIFEALRENRTLRKLDLQGAVLGHAAVLALCEALAKNTTLLELILEIDQLDAEDAAAIASAVQGNVTLLEFTLGDASRLQPATLEKILSTLRVNKFIVGIVETSGFNRTFDLNAPKVRSVIESKLNVARPERDLGALMEAVSAKFLTLTTRAREADDQKQDMALLLEKILSEGLPPTAAAPHPEPEPAPLPHPALQGVGQRDVQSLRASQASQGGNVPWTGEAEPQYYALQRMRSDFESADAAADVQSFYDGQQRFERTAGRPQSPASRDAARQQQLVYSEPAQFVPRGASPTVPRTSQAAASPHRGGEAFVVSDDDREFSLQRAAQARADAVQRQRGGSSGSTQRPAEFGGWSAGPGTPREAGREPVARTPSSRSVQAMAQSSPISELSSGESPSSRRQSLGGGSRPAPFADLAAHDWPQQQQQQQQRASSAASGGDAPASSRPASSRNLLSQQPSAAADAAENPGLRRPDSPATAQRNASEQSTATQQRMQPPSRQPSAATLADPAAQQGARQPLSGPGGLSRHASGAALATDRPDGPHGRLPTAPDAPEQQQQQQQQQQPGLRLAPSRQASSGALLEGPQGAAARPVQRQQSAAELQAGGTGPGDSRAQYAGTFSRQASAAALLDQSTSAPVGTSRAQSPGGGISRSSSLRTYAIDGSRVYAVQPALQVTPEGALRVGFEQVEQPLVQSPIRAAPVDNQDAEFHQPTLPSVPSNRSLRPASSASAPAASAAAEREMPRGVSARILDTLDSLDQEQRMIELVDRLLETEHLSQQLDSVVHNEIEAQMSRVRAELQEDASDQSRLMHDQFQAHKAAVLEHLQQREEQLSARVDEQEQRVRERLGEQDEFLRTASGRLSAEVKDSEAQLLAILEDKLAASTTSKLRELNIDERLADQDSSVRALSLRLKKLEGDLAERFSGELEQQTAPILRDLSKLQQDVRSVQQSHDEELRRIRLAGEEAVRAAEDAYKDEFRRLQLASQDELRHMQAAHNDALRQLRLEVESSQREVLASLRLEMQTTKKAAEGVSAALGDFKQDELLQIIRGEVGKQLKTQLQAEIAQEVQRSQHQQTQLLRDEWAKHVSDVHVKLTQQQSLVRQEVSAAVESATRLSNTLVTLPQTVSEQLSQLGQLNQRVASQERMIAERDGELDQLKELVALQAQQLKYAREQLQFHAETIENKEEIDRQRLAELGTVVQERFEERLAEVSEAVRSEQRTSVSDLELAIQRTLDDRFARIEDAPLRRGSLPPAPSPRLDRVLSIEERRLRAEAAREQSGEDLLRLQDSMRLLEKKTESKIADVSSRLHYIEAGLKSDHRESQRALELLLAD